MTNLPTAIIISIMGLPIAIMLAVLFYGSVLLQAFKYIKTYDKR